MMSVLHYTNNNLDNTNWAGSRMQYDNWASETYQYSDDYEECYDPSYAAWYSKSNPYTKNRSKPYRKRVTQAESRLKWFNRNRNLTKAQSDDLRRSTCPYCEFNETCQQYQTMNGCFHLCLRQSKGYWSRLRDKKIWFSRVWVYVPRWNRANTLENYELAIIDTLQTEDGISLRELSRRVEVPVSTCRKIVNRLVEEGRITKAETLINGRVHHLIYVVKVEELEHTVFSFKSIKV